MIIIKDFEKIKLHIGTIEDVEAFPEAKNPSYKLRIDFGPYGKKWSSAQITKNYSKEDLMGKQICAVTNLGNKKIGLFTSQVLILGAEDDNGDILLIEPAQNIKNGSRVN